MDYQDLLSELDSDMEDVWKNFACNAKTITESYLSHLVACLKSVLSYLCALKFQQHILISSVFISRGHLN